MKYLKGASFIDNLHSRTAYTIPYLYRRVLLNRGVIKDLKELKCDPLMIHNLLVRSDCGLNVPEVGDYLGDEAMKNFGRNRNILLAYQVSNTQQKTNFIYQDVR